MSESDNNESKINSSKKEDRPLYKFPLDEQIVAMAEIGVERLLNARLEEILREEAIEREREKEKEKAKKNK
jgi:hypothetical protein